MPKHDDEGNSEYLASVEFLVSFPCFAKKSSQTENIFCVGGVVCSSSQKWKFSFTIMNILISAII